MGAIPDALSAAFRDYVIDGVPGSGANKPRKSEIRALGAVIEGAIATGSLGSVTTTKATKAALDGDLAFANGATAIVFADSTDANNDLYVKSGGSGTGSWTNTGALHLIMESLGQPYVDAANAAAAELEGQIDNTERNTDARGRTAAGLAFIGREVLRPLATERNADALFTPSTYKEWAVGFTVPEDAPEAAVVSGVRSRHYLTAGTVRLEARLYSRASDGDLTLGPEQVGDVAEWDDWQVKDSSDFGFDTETVVIFDWRCPDGQEPVAKDKAFYLRVRAFLANGDREEIGIVQGEQVDAPAGAHIRRGFYRTTDAGSWSAITPVSLAGALLSLDYAPARPGKDWCVGIRSGITEYSFDNSTPVTFQMAMTLAGAADEVRICLAHSNLNAVPVGPFAVAAVASEAELDDIPDDRWIPATFDGQSEIVMPPRPSDRRRTLVWSDDTGLRTIARTDVPGAPPIIAIRAYCSEAGSIRLLGNSTGDANIEDWADHPERPHWFRADAGNCVDAPGDFTSTVNIATSMIVGAAYRVADGRLAMTLGNFGDSTCEGADGTLWGDNAVSRAALALQSETLAVDWCTWAWTGASMQAIKEQIEDTLRACDDYGVPVPHYASMPNATVNSITPPNTEAQMNDQGAYALNGQRMLQRAGVVPGVATIIPTSTEHKNVGASDQYRRDYNDAYRAKAGKGLLVVDRDAAIAAEVVDGQTQPSDTLTDGIHYTDAGKAVVGALEADAIREAAPALGYVLGRVVAP